MLLSRTTRAHLDCYCFDFGVKYFAGVYHKNLTNFVRCCAADRDVPPYEPLQKAHQSSRRVMGYLISFATSVVSLVEPSFENAIKLLGTAGLKLC